MKYTIIAHINDSNEVQRASTQAWITTNFPGVDILSVTYYDAETGETLPFASWVRIEFEAESTAVQTYQDMLNHASAKKYNVTIHKCFHEDNLPCEVYP